MRKIKMKIRRLRTAGLAFVALTLAFAMVIPTAAMERRTMSATEVERTARELSEAVKAGKKNPFRIEDVSYESAEAVKAKVDDELFPHYFGVEVKPDDDGYYVDMTTSLARRAVNVRVDEMTKAICRKVPKKLKKKRKAERIEKILCRKMSYRTTGESDEAVLKNLRKWRGECWIYAMVYKACCEKMGIRCRTICGFWKGEPHEWNRVKVGKKWYYVDATRDDAGGGKPRLSRKLWKRYRIDGVSED